MPVSVQDNRWTWLFQPSVCDGLLSLSASPVRAEDISWLLRRMPRMLDLRVSRRADLERGRDLRTIIAHQNLKQLFLGFEFSDSFISCPNLIALTSYLPSQIVVPTPSPSWDPKVNLSNLSIHFAADITASLHSYGLDLSTLTRLCITSVTTNSLSQVVDAVGSNLLPNLSHLLLQLSPPAEGCSVTPPSRTSTPLLSLIANNLHQLTQSRGAKSHLLTIDCRVPRHGKITSSLFHIVRVLRQAAIHTSVNLDACTIDEPFNPYTALQSIDNLLDAEPQVRAPSFSFFS